MTNIDNRQQCREAIAELVKRARHAAGISQVQLAERAGLSRTNIERIESAKYNVTIDTLSLIARALDKQIAFAPLN